MGATTSSAEDFSKFPRNFFRESSIEQGHVCSQIGLGEQRKTPASWPILRLGRLLRCGRCVDQRVSALFARFALQLLQKRDATPVAYRGSSRECAAFDLVVLLGAHGDLDLP